MKNAIRCCISCILPCGSLDVIRIVHANGHVEEIAGTIQASEIMKANPKHILKKPSSPSSYTDKGVTKCPKIMILSPDVKLQRGKIYFLVPASMPDQSMPRKTGSRSSSSSSSTSSKKMSSEKSNHVVMWRPRLESISEATSDA
ncbi:uncharacterized protein LOC112527036 [Cynara cardunculus var. scolymus]|uniref:Uncharacterized protein n=1 Tax=Cynara cardunculus var. scolymus TaxID=59895 RepID=A0A118JSN4_CYNCS|nr:uncharacterized protein LOC112527036 [Cynara cardunculus var. scolymus]KVH89482.1 Protein of unknown function DUF4228 [Cynara cardunculus var. scolymus]